MRIDVSRGVSHLRDEPAIMSLPRFPLRQYIFESPELPFRSHPERVVLSSQPHYTRQGTIEDAQLFVFVPPYEEEPTRLIGREGKAQRLGTHPSDEAS